MSIHKTTLRTIVFLLLGGLGLQARPWPHAESDLPVDSRLQMGHLPNGIRYVLLPWNEPPGRISLQMLVEAGFLHETERQIGLAHLLEHMAFNGTRNFSAGEMVEYFQRLGMAFGADTNAHTWWRETVYKLELPDTGESLLRDGLKLFRDYADGMLLEEAEIESEKGIVLSELRERDTPGSRAYRAQLNFSLPDSWVARWRSSSEMDILRMSTRQDLVDFYQKWYVPENIVLVAVGELDPVQLVALFEEYFGDMQPAGHDLSQPDMGVIRPVATQTGFFSQADLPAASVQIFLRRPIQPEPDTLEQQIADARLDLANSILERRLDRLAKEETAVILSGAAYDYRWLEFVRFTGLAVSARPEDWEAALRVATRELNRALEFGFGEAELSEAREQMLTSLRQDAERESTRLSRNLSASLVRSIRDGFVFMDPAERLRLLAPAVERMTPAEVWEAFREAWAPEERMVWVNGNFAKLSDMAFATARAEEVSAPAERQLTEFAYTDFGSPGEVVQRYEVEDLATTHVTFANGVRLNLKQTDFEANRIAVKVSFGNGQLVVPKDLPGIATLASATFITGGLGAHSFDDIRAFLASRTATISFDIDSEFFALSGSTNRDDLLFQLQLLAAYLTDPGYRPEARRLYLRQLDAIYNQLRTDPNAVLQTQGSQLLASGDPRFGFPARAELEARTLEEVAAWLQPELRAGYLEMSVVGDFADKEVVIAAVAQTIGALPQRAEAYDRMPASRTVSFPLGPLVRMFPYSADMEFGIVAIHWPTLDNSEVEPVRRLGVLGRILGDRMRKVVREQTGESYSPFAFNNSTPWQDYGFIRAYSGVHPRSAMLVQDLILQIAGELATNGTDADELMRMIEPAKSSARDTRRTNNYWTNSVLLRAQSEPQRLEWARSFVDFWDTITVAEINELAARFLDNDAAVILRILPEATIEALN